MYEELRKGHRKAVIISIVLIGSVLFDAVVVELLKLYGGLNYPLATDAGLFKILKYVFLGLAVVDFFVIKILRSISTAGMRKLGMTGAKLVNSMVVMSVVEGAICVSVAASGLVLFYLGGDAAHFYKHLVTSLVLLGYFFPRLSDWEERWRAAELVH